VIAAGSSPFHRDETVQRPDTSRTVSCTEVGQLRSRPARDRGHPRLHRRRQRAARDRGVTPKNEAPRCYSSRRARCLDQTPASCPRAGVWHSTEPRRQRAQQGRQQPPTGTRSQSITRRRHCGPQWHGASKSPGGVQSSISPRCHHNPGPTIGPSQPAGGGGAILGGTMVVITVIQAGELVIKRLRAPPEEGPTSEGAR
jgi:hypothetical protein